MAEYLNFGQALNCTMAGRLVFEFPQICQIWID